MIVGGLKDPEKNSCVFLMFPRCGEVTAQHIGIMSIAAMSEAKTLALPANQFAKKFFKYSHLQTTDTKNVSNKTIDSLSDSELELLVKAYLSQEQEAGIIDKAAYWDSEQQLSATETLKSIVVNLVKKREPLNTRIIDIVGKMNLSDSLRDSILKTDSLIRASDYSSDYNFSKPNLTEVTKRALSVSEGLISPVAETNKMLKILNQHIEKVVQLNESQARIFQSLADTANLSLAASASSAAEAEKTTRLTKKGIVVAIIAVIISGGISIMGVFDAHRSSVSSDQTFRNLTAQISLTSEQQLAVLKKISSLISKSDKLRTNHHSHY